MKYPITLAAVKAADKNHWAIGDALLDECGPPSQSGQRDGSSHTLQEAAEYLAAEGFKYTAGTLSQIRATAFAFKSPDRRAGVSFGAHRLAGSPEYLKAIIAGAPKGQRITQDYIEGIRSSQIAELKREREAAEEKARKEREKAEAKAEKARAKARAAKDKGEKEEADREVAQAKAEAEQAEVKERETRSAPKKRPTPPEPDEVPVLAIQSQFIADAIHSRRLAIENMKRIKARLDELTPKGYAALTAAALEAANAWTEAARIVRSELANSSDHLSVVGE